MILVDKNTRENAMKDELVSISSTLHEIQETLESQQIPGNSFNHQFGWTHAALNRHDIAGYISRFNEKLGLYDGEISEEFVDILDDYVMKLTHLHSHIKSYFTNNANHMVHIVPVMINTLNIIFHELEYELFGWDIVDDKKSLPRSLATRLRSTRTRIDNLNASSEGLEEKVKTINEAHEAAEMLPTDLKELKESKQELSNLLGEANKVFRKIEIAQQQADDTLESIKEHEHESQGHRNLTEEYVSQCDEALQITTTQGLAAGFDQKAKALSKSIYIWGAILLIALGIGAGLGYVRVNALTEALSTELSTGQALLHAMISVFSIGGPLWLAWLATSQINQRFKLAEDYAYKATVAKSFTGFNKHAERFDPETAERLFNSTLDRLDEMPLRLVSAKDYNSPWHELLDSPILAKAIDNVPEIADVINRFGNKTKLKRKVTKENVHPMKTVKADDEEKPDNQTTA